MRNFKILIALFVSVGLLGVIPKSHAAFSDPLTTIELETPVHFLAPDGSDLLVESGTYAIEPAEEWIRLMSGERHDAVLIEAKKGMHEIELEHPMAISVPGEIEQELDLHHITLLLPGGQSLDATGTYSGIRARGIFNKTFGAVKTNVNRAYKKARSLSKKTPDEHLANFLRLNTEDPNKKPEAHTQLKKHSATARKHLRHIKSNIEKNARQAWRKARQLYQKAKRRAGTQSR